MKRTYLALIFTALVGLAIGRIGDHGDEVEQDDGDFVEKPERELDQTGFGGLETEDPGGLFDPGYFVYGGFGKVGAEYTGELSREVDPGLYSGDQTGYGGFGKFGAEYSGDVKREVDPAYYSGSQIGYGGFGKVGAEYRVVEPDEEYRVFVACFDDGRMERVKSLGQVHYEYHYVKAIAMTISIDTFVRLNNEADVV